MCPKNFHGRCGWNKVRTTLISRLTKRQIQGGIIGDRHYFNFSKCDEKRDREPVTSRKERWQ